MTPWDDRPCDLGEGPLWHPGRGQLFWFDITRGRMLSREGDTPREWQMGEMASAAGWVDDDTLLVATESALRLFHLPTARYETVAKLEADDPVTRSNDGRADPWGGFWIGTMGKDAEPGAGGFYRYFRGELRLLWDGITIPNAICFDEGRACAYLTDTPTGIVERRALDPATGWPVGEPETFLDLNHEGLNPDGAVTDAEGNLWLAQWGASRVAAYSPEGRLIYAASVPGAHSSCPAFGGEDYRTLFVTTARQALEQHKIAEEPRNGMVFAIEGLAPGRPEPRVIL